MKPDYSGIVKPLPAVSEITTGLWQGIRPATYSGYDLVVSCEQHLARKPMEDYAGLVLHIAMVDDDAFKIPERQIAVAASAAAAMVREGGNVLVHCSGGLNRSSLVTAHVLMDLYDWGPRAAVYELRAKRDEFCLCNRAFERWVLGDVLPTAETSTFRASGTDAA